MNDALRIELLAMEVEDRQVRAETPADGSLLDGHHPAMQAVHDRNAARLTDIMFTPSRNAPATATTAA